MKTVYIFLIKEFKQIFRNKGMLPIIFIAPVIQLLVLSYAVDYEIKNLKLFVIDKDHSSFSKKLVHQMGASQYFTIVGSSSTDENGFLFIEQNDADVCLIIPQGFEKDIFTNDHPALQILLNAIDGSKAGLASFYTQSIIRQFNMGLLKDNLVKTSALIGSKFKEINIKNRYWYNPNLNYKVYMVPGILVLLVTMIGSFLSSMNIVREKEIGTIEQLNVSPIKKYQFIMAKTLPFLIIAMFELTIGLIVAKIVFDIPMEGSMLVLYSFAILYMLVVLGLGLFISTLTDTQQQAMFISWFFLVVFILMGGLFTAIENMPPWARTITYLNPVRYFIEANRMILLKGAGWFELRYHFLVVGTYALLIFSLAIFRYKKTT